MRKFEIPFNHSEELITYLDQYKEKLLPYISHLLVAPFKDDLRSTRHQEAGKPLNRKVYEDQIKRLQKLGYEVAILFNSKDNVSVDICNYYINKLNCKTFIIYNDIVALYLKQNYKDITTIASITKKLSLNDIKNKNLSMYDYIVLFYTFNTSLNNIKDLPKENKYILLVNTFCDYTCDFNSHWFDETLKFCPRSINGYKNTTLIFQEDLELFDPYISIYKLQGREYSTDKILRDLLYWIFGKERYKPAIDIYNDLRQNDPNQYYNRYKK